MRTLKFCFLSSLSALAAAQNTANASEKARKLEKLANAAPNHVVKLTTALFDEFTTGQRDYTLSVVLTALQPQYKCGPCVEFNPVHQAIAKQWHKGADQPLEKHYFGVLDFPDGQDVFRRVGWLFVVKCANRQLQLNTAPIAKFFKPTIGPNASPKAEPDHFDFRGGASAPEYSRWIVSQKPGSSFTYKPPIRWDRIFSTSSVALLGAVVVYKNWSILGPLVTGRFIWAAGTLSVILLMTSGYMWNQIRHPPYLTPQGMIAGGYSNQYGVETHIIAALYGMLGLTVYTLISTLPRIKNPQYQRLGIYIWIGLLILLHSVLISIFKIKNPGYPFKMLL